MIPTPPNSTRRKRRWYAARLREWHNLLAISALAGVSLPIALQAEKTQYERPRMFVAGKAIAPPPQVEPSHNLAFFLLLARAQRTGGIFNTMGGDPPGGGVGTAELPRVTPSYTPSNATTGTVHSPLTAADLQTLLAGSAFAGHTLVAGDTILLQRGTLYVSAGIPQQSFGFFAGADTSPIRVITSNTAAIPAPGARWVPATHRHAQSHFVGQAGSAPPVVFPDGAQGWQFVGIQTEVGDTYYQYWLILLGTESYYAAWDSGTTYYAGQHVAAPNGDVTGTTGQFDMYCTWVSLADGNVGNTPLTSSGSWRKLVVADLPNKIVFDRCEFSANTHNKCRNIFMANSQEVIWTGCHIWNEGGPGVEDKGIGGVNVAGPWLVDNCQITASGIGSLIGGADPGIVGLNPYDITYRRSYFFRPSRFNPYDVSWDGLARVKKNHFELKRGNRVLLEDCLFENDWEGGTSQFWTVVAKVSNQDGTGDLGLTNDITFRYLRFKNCQGPFGVGARDNYTVGGLPCAAMHDISIYQCYSETLFGVLPGASGYQRMMQLQRPTYRLHLEHLTFLGDESKTIDISFAEDTGDATPAYWTWRNLVFSFGTYGMAADSAAITGDQYFTNGPGSSGAAIHLFTAAHSVGGHYPNPPFTTYTTADDLVVDYAGNNFRTNAALIGTGYNGETPGADIDTINTRTAGCVSGVWP